LDELPETLDGTYEQTLQGIDKQKRGYACRLFQCLVVSKRPLRVEELAELFAIQPNVETIPTFDASLRPENPEEFVLSACSTLVAVVNVGDIYYPKKIVQFSHFSVREYLTSHRIAISGHVSCFHVSQRPAHALLARACLGVLLQLDVDRNNTRRSLLAQYAAAYWVGHAQFENISSDIQHVMEYLFDRNRPHFKAWLLLSDIDSDGYRSSSIPRTTPLYYAALCGFRDVAEHLLDAYPQDANTRGGKHKTPLHAAAAEGHLNVAMLLLERGADMKSLDSFGRTPLHLASCCGYAKVVSLLIDRGADLDAEESKKGTPLHLALRSGHKDTVQLLLDRGADANHPDNRGRTPLHLSSEIGHDDFVRLLLDFGADANHPDDSGNTPLFLALEWGHDDIARLLLDHGADANHPDDSGRTSLHHASHEGRNVIVQLLLDYSAVVNHPDKYAWTPLHLASQLGHNETVQLLLDHGADADPPNRRGWTPLHLASQEGHNDTVQLLLNQGAEANRLDNSGWAALHRASIRGHRGTVQLLLDRGAAVNRSSDRGGTPLRLASLQGRNDIVQLLFDHGAVANYREGTEEDEGPWFNGFIVGEAA
jgi:ankyrin repeat protein